MASLAVDAFRKFLREEILTTVSISSLSQLRSGVVAKHTAVVNLARKVEVLLPVVCWADPPALFLGIPRHRQLCQNSSHGKIQVTTSMISGADDVLDFLFKQVHFPALLQLVSLLEEPAITADHAVVPARGLMKEAIVSFIVF